MKQISFRPFRRVGDKLVITSYMGWRKIYTANYCNNTVRLLTIPDVKNGELIYSFGKTNYWQPVKFETLFWPINGRIRYVHHEEAIAMLQAGLPHPYSYPIMDDEVYSCFDCDGCPAFSHKTSIYVAEHYADKMHLWEPLTASIVYDYFEKMRDELKNITWIK